MLIKQAIIICFFFTFIYSSIYNIRTTTDTITAALLPVALIRGQGFDLKEISPLATNILPTKKNANGLPHYIIEKNEHQISAFPVFSSVLAVPIYIVPVIIKNITLANLGNNINLVFSLSKVSSSFFSAVSVALVFLSLRQILPFKKSLIMSTIYALGTSTFSISSQAMWQHAASQMFLATTIFFFLSGQKNKHQIAYCGFTLGLATLCRFPNLVIALLFFFYILFFEKKSLPGFIKYTIPPLIFFFWYQLTYPGELFFYKYEALGEIAKFNNSPIEGFLGLLISPNKGIFIYSPIFLLSIWGIGLSWTKKIMPLMFFSLVVILYMAFLAKWNVWHGSWSYGPRMLADITPFLTILIAPVIKNPIVWHNYKFKTFFVLIGLISIFVHFLGASFADFSWYSMQTAFLTSEQAKHANIIWNWHYPEIYYFYFKAGGFLGLARILSFQILNIDPHLVKGAILMLFSYLVVVKIFNTLIAIKTSLKKTRGSTKKKEYN